MSKSKYPLLKERNPAVDYSRCSIEGTCELADTTSEEHSAFQS